MPGHADDEWNSLEGERIFRRDSDRLWRGWASVRDRTLATDDG
jgi:hypothetical protein